MNKTPYISHFTPSLMTPEALERVFVQREDLADRLVELVEESVLTPAKHHSLLIGPRGMGKTHLIALVHHRVQEKSELQGRLLIAWLREEEWGIASFLDFLLRLLNALGEKYGEKVIASEHVEALYDMPAAQAERAAMDLLTAVVGDRALLLMVENLDEVFDGLGETGQKKLRAYLQERENCTILATAQSLFSGVQRQTSPFYGFFRIHHLKGLTLDEAVELIEKIARLRGDHELASYAQTPQGRARIRAVRHLAGGNHRVYVIFSQFINRASLDELVEPFMRTLDDLTPYYQSRMKHLSNQQRKIVDFLVDIRHAVPVKEIARRCFITPQTASGQLKKLREMGYVRSDAYGRESYYELREVLMRLCLEVKNYRGEPIRLFVEFLRLWYAPTELEQRLASLPENMIDVAVRYRETSDERVLLALPAEERAALIEALGMEERVAEAPE